MATLLVTMRDGQVRTLTGDDGHSVMEIIRDAGVDELLALCGGCLSCATCHVYVAETDMPRLPEMSEAEDDLLDSSDNRSAQSRLSCQLPFGSNLDGLRVTIAPET
jgi:2Fe-2S ferredoxin